MEWLELAKNNIQFNWRLVALPNYVEEQQDTHSYIQYQLAH